MTKYYVLFLAGVIVTQSAFAAVATMDFKNFVFPEIKGERDVDFGTHHIQRRIYVSEGKIIRDEFKQSAIIPNEELLPQDYCALEVQYMISNGDLPKGLITINSAQYDVKVRVESGITNVGPVNPGTEEPVTVEITHALRSEKNAYDFARIKTRIAGTGGYFMLTGVQCRQSVARDSLDKMSVAAVISKSFGKLAQVVAK